MKRFNSKAQLTLISISASLFCVSGTPQAATTSAQCRGVAAGVVAGMRASGELTSQDASEIAIKAARRACAARDELTPTTGDMTVTETPEDEGNEGKITMWDLLSSEQESKPGSKRLKRLRQQ